MTNKFRTVLIIVLLGSHLTGKGQRSNHVLQNSPSSYGFSIATGVNTFQASGISFKRSMGIKNSFGVSYLLNQRLMCIESGISFGHQRIRFGEKRLLDSTNNQFAFKLVSLGVPINLNYKFSQNRRRTYLLLGINPEIVIKSSVVQNADAPRHPENISILSHSKKANFLFGGQFGVGRSYDLDPSVMMRIELGYQFSLVNVLENRYRIGTLGLRLQFMNHN